MEINKSALAWFAIFVRSSSGTNVSSERVYTTSAPGSRCSMIFPSRSATSRHRSFSIKPVGPIVPVSWPPWPASITILPIFNPSVRVSVDCPSRVGCGALAALIKSGFAFVGVTLADLALAFFALGRELRGVTEGVLPAVARLIRSEEHTSELQSRQYLVCRLLLEKKKKTYRFHKITNI